MLILEPQPREVSSSTHRERTRPELFRVAGGTAGRNSREGIFCLPGPPLAPVGCLTFWQKTFLLATEPCRKKEVVYFIPGPG